MSWANVGAIASVGLFVVAVLPLILKFMLQGMIRTEIEKVINAFSKRIAKMERRVSRLEGQRERGRRERERQGERRD